VKEIPKTIQYLPPQMKSEGPKRQQQGNPKNIKRAKDKKSEKSTQSKKTANQKPPLVPKQAARRK
jgi:hypothetical protein